MLGHLQAFGLRPIGELEVRAVHETDWAEAWKRHVPVLRIGRRVVIRPSWRRHRATDEDWIVTLAIAAGTLAGRGAIPAPAVVTPDLTQREREIAELAAGGSSNREIAERLFVSVRTVENHLQHVYDKLGISGRRELGGTMATSPTMP